MLYRKLRKQKTGKSRRTAADTISPTREREERPLFSQGCTEGVFQTPVEVKRGQHTWPPSATVGSMLLFGSCTYLQARVVLSIIDHRFHRSPPVCGTVSYLRAYRPSWGTLKSWAVVGGRNKPSSQGMVFSGWSQPAIRGHWFSSWTHVSSGKTVEDWCV